MFDTEMKEQLKNVFARLDGPVVLRVRESSHPNQEELLSMLREVASASEKIRVEAGTSSSSSASDEAPYFEVIGSQGGGIFFRGIPGGHEFTSLILAILHSDGKGKLPDEGMIRRIRSLQGPARIRTYVSLSCENCPEVVQSLNLIASLHPGIEHEMIDGAYAQSEVEALGIQGVPSVVFDGKLIHSGKAAFIDLLKELETRLGVLPLESFERGERSLGKFDVAVVGGGPAGISAAIYSARKGLRTVLIAERLGGQVQETKGIENMISIPYTEGARLAAQLNDHLVKYPVKLLEHRRVKDICGDEKKTIQLEGGESLEAGAVIIATGAKWRELGIPGEKEYLGRGVAFCAHCDGPFYRDKRVAVVGGGNSGVEAAIDLAGIARSVVLIEFGDQLKADAVLKEKLASLSNASVILGAKSQEILGDGKKVIGLEYQDRKTQQVERLELDGVFVQIGLLPNSQCVRGRVDLSPAGEILVDAKGRTSAPGIYAAGDVTTIPFKQIVIAMGDGAKVALTAFEDRMHAPVRQALPASG